jgi:hypothetical protein
MRQDKITTKLQEAIADAQIVAVGNDNQYIEPVHLLTALLNQDDGGARSLLQRAGATRRPALRASPSAAPRPTRRACTGWVSVLATRRRGDHATAAGEAGGIGFDESFVNLIMSI